MLAIGHHPRHSPLGIAPMTYRARVETGGYTSTEHAMEGLTMAAVEVDVSIIEQGEGALGD
jgi:hypothetical protein